jgi:long-chain acyl-CoA synthetase
VLSILEPIQTHAGRAGQKIALVTEEREISYAGLLARAAAYRDCLKQHDIKPGQRIGHALSDDIETVAAIFGIWAVGATAVPMDFRSKSSQRGLLVTKFELALVFEDTLKANAGYRSVGLAKVPTIGKWTTVIDFVRAPAFIATTSGSTGLPTGIVIPHATYFYRLDVYRVCYPVAEASKTLCCYPLSFAASRTLCMMTLAAGGTCYLAPALASGEELVEIIKTQEITELYIVPVTLEAILEAASPGALASLWYIGFGSASASQELKDRAVRELPCGIVEVYSATSTGALSFHTKKSLVERPETVGRIFEGVEVSIADDAGNEVAIGQHGLVRTRGPATLADVIGGHAGGDFIRDGWAYPGDIGYVDAEGYLTLVGRSNDMIVRGGEKIFPSEIEAVLFGHPSISDVAVVGLPDGRVGEVVGVAVCLREPITNHALRAYCVNKLQASKVPAVFHVLKELPRNSNGKILRHEVVRLISMVYRATGAKA